jgi:type I restriction enzyme S subunit
MVKSIQEKGLVEDLPRDWKFVRLGDICSLRRDTVQPQDFLDLPYVGLEHISPGNPQLKGCGDPSQVRSSKSRFFPSDILYGKLRPYLDKCVIAPREGICSTDILVLRTKDEMTVPEFLVNLLHTRNFLSHAISTTSGTNHPRTSWKAISQFEFSLPSLTEQRAIAHVLSTVREAIEATERVIAAARELKRSLMKHLFTYGPVPVDEAENVVLKETEIGEVPEEWELMQIADVADINKSNRDPKDENPNEYFIYVDISSIDSNTGRIVSSAQLLGKDAPSRARRVINKNDVILSTVRPYLKAFTLIPEEFDDQICSTGFAVLTAKENVLPKYLLYVSLSDLIGDQFKKQMKGASYPAINTNDVKNTLIPIPPREKQSSILTILSNVDNKIQIEAQRKIALETLFESLLRHLMTGKVRVI